MRGTRWSTGGSPRPRCGSTRRASRPARACLRQAGAGQRPELRQDQPRGRRQDGQRGPRGPRRARSAALRIDATDGSLGATVIGTATVYGLSGDVLPTITSAAAAALNADAAAVKLAGTQTLTGQDLLRHADPPARREDHARRRRGERLHHERAGAGRAALRSEARDDADPPQRRAHRALRDRAGLRDPAADAGGHGAERLLDRGARRGAGQQPRRAGRRFDGRAGRGGQGLHPARRDRPPRHRPHAAGLAGRADADVLGPVTAVLSRRRR